VKMTAMPQMVALFNGFGGGASALVASGEYARMFHAGSAPETVTAFAIALGLLVGWTTFSGSLIAYAKLQGILKGVPLTFPGQKAVNLLLLISFVVIAVVWYLQPGTWEIFAVLAAFALFLGALFVLPIGGADMPVVISFLNSLSGVAAAVAGFIVMNQILIIAGALVGASGLILTQIMCKAMNRTLGNVLFGAFGKAGSAGAAASAEGKTVRSIGPEEGAAVLAYAKSVVIVPGYGMAVAQAQHAARELADLLESRGVEVKYAIHPVAGRMPGHMNVLLAEANVPYEKLYEMESINPEFERTDAVLVVGANDVVNPAAKNSPGSPIYGMPILETYRAGHIIVIKRSMNPGFAGIENELFYGEKTMMLFGGAKEMLTRLAGEIKELG